VGYGSNGNFAALKIGEDVTDADSGDTKVALLNVAESGALDVYLTDDDISLDDATPTFSAVAEGSAAASTTIDSGTYRLRVTGSGDTSDLRLDVASITLDSTKVASIILTGTPSGVLVNAILLPQQGSVTAFDNTKARVRAAVAVANGALATVGIGGTTLLTSQPVNVINSKYTQIEAGSSLAVNLTVGGSAVSVANQSLTAGADYTLLVYTDANSSTQTSLFTDDNHLPSSSSLTKIRLLNGMSGLGTAVTLSVDNSPVAEGVALGTASSYAEVDSGSDIQLDVTETNTAANLLTRTDVTLLSSGVYTLFMSGGGTSAVTNTLRKDR
jgi:hypothetical protein